MLNIFSTKNKIIAIYDKKLDILRLYDPSSGTNYSYSPDGLRVAIDGEIYDGQVGYDLLEAVFQMFILVGDSGKAFEMLEQYYEYLKETE